MIKQFSDLEAWQKAHNLAITIYRVTTNFPKEERFGLIDQLRRAGVSVTSNISEGFGRISYKDKLRFYYMASGSISELRSQIMLSKDLHFIDNESYKEISNKIEESHKLLHGLIRSTGKYLKVPTPIS